VISNRWHAIKMLSVSAAHTAGIDIVHVLFRGVPEATNDIIATLAQLAGIKPQWIFRIRAAIK
jgi:hypothetical protein